MNRIRLGAASLAILLGTAVTAPADSFVYTGNLQTETISVTGTYLITASAGSGGSGNNGAVSGGLGATLSGDYVLTAGTTYNVVVGGHGVNDVHSYGGGGGGGTFIYITNATSPLLVAGGGGGAGYMKTSDYGVGGNAQTGTAGGSPTAAGAGGTNGTGGQPGTYGMYDAGGGAGWLGAGMGDSYGAGGGSSKPTFAGGAGANEDFYYAAAGAYGGGGGAAEGGGGGGGYSGGGGGYGGGANGTYCGAGGGGSFSDPMFTNLTALVTNSGNGSASFTFVPNSVPEPASVAMMGLGLVIAGVAAAGRRRRAETA